MGRHAKLANVQPTVYVKVAARAPVKVPVHAQQDIQVNHVPTVQLGTRYYPGQKGYARLHLRSVSPHVCLQ